MAKTPRSVAQSYDVCLPNLPVVFAVDRAGLVDKLGSSSYPLVLKPARSKVLLGGAVVSTAVHVARNQADAMHGTREGQHDVDPAEARVR